MKPVYLVLLHYIICYVSDGSLTPNAGGLADTAGV